MFEWLSVRVNDLAVRHTPDVLGVFEPLSEIIFVNLTNEQLVTGLDPDPADAAALQVNEMVNHEIYHYYQVFCAGYLYRQVLRLAEARRAVFAPNGVWGPAAGRMRKELGHRIKAATRFWMPRADRAWFQALDTMEAAQHHVTQVERLAAQRGERTLGAVLSPGLFQALEAVRAPATSRGPSGLSAEDVYEGSAFVFGKLAAYGAELGGHLYEDGPYGRLLRFSRDRLGDRATPAVVLLSAAVALRNEDPGETFAVALPRIAQAPPGAEEHQARALTAEWADHPPPGHLGTAWDVRRGRGRRDRRVKIYEKQLRAVHTGAWHLDELDLLSRPGALGGIPPGDLGFTFVTRDGQAGNPRLFGARLLIGSAMLPTGPSVASLRRNLARHWADAAPFLADTFPGARIVRDSGEQ